ncbi:sterile alpha motif domain containing 1 [Cichlidogyrus casuarinus]|uniref:Sterile alpha motif domain containing 1 n=1 Tax=Cichlidogyrus casuarinus TaxID=1844966 RepID=A0ABD2PSW4_9PLAT
MYAGQQILPPSANGSKIVPSPIYSSLPVADQIKWQGLLCCRCDKPSHAQDEFLQCTGCKITAHPSCLDYWSDLTARARVCGWECGDCKKCIVCADKSSPALLYICDACDQGYHATCHKPNISEEVAQDSSEPWVCSRCKSEGFFLKGPAKQETSPQPPVVMKIKKSPSPRKLTSSDQYEVVDMTKSEEAIKKEKENTEPEEDSPKERKRSHPSSNEESTKERLSLVPTPSKQPKRPTGRTAKIKTEDDEEEAKNVARPKDVKTWTVNQVKQWLVEQNYEKEGDCFAAEEIDGACLLLMKRMDLLTDLGIKLGPAVKIFERIKLLQAQCEASLSPNE